MGELTTTRRLPSRWTGPTLAPRNCSTRYTFLHPDARLSESEKLTLIEGFSQTFGEEVERD